MEKSSVCLLNCGPTGSETLKNLVLGGIGSITVVDGSKVELGDLGNNFMGILPLPSAIYYVFITIATLQSADFCFWLSVLTLYSALSSSVHPLWVSAVTHFVHNHLTSLLAVFLSIL